MSEKCLAARQLCAVEPLSPLPDQINRMLQTSALNDLHQNHDDRNHQEHMN